VQSLTVAPRLRRIGEVAEATGLTQRAIRYYEEFGLLKPAAHVSGGNRRYDDEDLARLHLIKQLREVVGLGLADIRTFVSTEEERHVLRAEYDETTDPERRRDVLERAEPVLRRRIELLERKLAALQQFLREEQQRLQRVISAREALAV
jgi:DNA-binding transcriptional MerR regulator